MTTINTNVNSLLAQNHVRRNNDTLATSLNRLSTGLRINRGQDDPAGLIASQFLNSEISGTQAAIANNQRANNVLATAEGAMLEINALLGDIRGLVTMSANSGVLSDAETEANQMMVDSALSSIDRIANTTTFSGRQLLDGSLAVDTEAGAGISRVDVGERPATAGDLALDIEVTAATHAVANDVVTSPISGDTSVVVKGSEGAQEMVFADGAALADVASQINAAAADTGVSATVDAGGLSLHSREQGADALVSIELLAGDARVSEKSGHGEDARVSVGGLQATVDDQRVNVHSGSLDVSFTLDESLANSGGQTSLTIKDGGAKFQIGQALIAGGQLQLGIGSLSTGALGSGAASLAAFRSDGARGGGLNPENIAAFAEAVDGAIAQVSVARGRIGSVQANTIETNINSLQVANENLGAARSGIVDTDFAQETTRLTKMQILNQSGTAALRIANHRSGDVLALLG